MWLALALATAVGAALRLPFLAHQSLWLDEIYTREILREASLSGVWRHVRATESTPPLFYALGWLVHARGAAAMRAIPALALTAAVPVGYLAFRRLVGSGAALAAAAILAVNPMLVWYSTDARSYGLFVLAALLTVWAFSAVLERASTRRFGLWAGASVACVWTHYFGVFVVAGEAVVLLATLPGARRQTLSWATLVGACLIPLLPLLASQSGDERAGFIAGVPLRTRVSEAVRQFAMGPNVPRAWLEAAGLAILAVAFAGGLWISWGSSMRARGLLALAAIAFLTPLSMSLLGIDDHFYARNVIAVLPLVAALAAPALLRGRAVPLAAYLLLATVASVWVASDWRYEQVDWKDAIARVQSIEPNAPLFAVTPGEAAPVVATYLDRPPATAPGPLAQRAWVLMEPVRAAGQRALGPAPVPHLPGFTAERTVELHGFQLVLESAAQPTRIAPGELAGATVFAGAG